MQVQTSSGTSINGMTPAQVRKIMEKQPSKVTRKMICVATFLGIITIIIGLFYFVKIMKVNSLNDGYHANCAENNTCVSGNYYDQHYLDGPFTDSLLGAQLKADIEKDCDTECMRAGIRWSTVYNMNAIVMLLITFQVMIMTIGICKMEARVFSCCCQCCFFIANLATIIVTAVYKFNDKGELASISMAGTKY